MLEGVNQVFQARAERRRGLRDQHARDTEVVRLRERVHGSVPTEDH